MDCGVYQMWHSFEQGHKGASLHTRRETNPPPFASSPCGTFARFVPFTEVDDILLEVDGNA